MENYIRRVIDIFTSSTQSEDNVSKFHNWLIDKENEEQKTEVLRDFWNEGKEELSRKEIERSLHGVYERIGLESQKSKTAINFGRIFRTTLKYAAVAALVVATAGVVRYITKEEYTKIAMVEDYTVAGERKTVVLPDGTVAQVNSSTVLIYPENFLGDTRTVFLQGEASFEVKRNEKQPFIVKSGAVSVTALGTKFNVQAYPEESVVKATLLNGKVCVDCGNEGESYILFPGEQVAYEKNTGKSIKNIVDMEEVTAWEDGVMVFRSVTLEEMLKILRRKYDMSFHLNHSHAFCIDRYSFRFSENASIDEVLEVMKKVVGNMEYEISGNKCTIGILRQFSE